MKHRGDSVAYPRDSREAFYMAEVDFLKARSEAESRGEFITAVYHSHVGAGAYFSEMDQEFAEKPFFPVPDAAHIIVAVWDRKVARVGIFERETSGAFAGRAIEAERP